MQPGALGGLWRAALALECERYNRIHSDGRPTAQNWFEIVASYIQPHTIHKDLFVVDIGGVGDDARWNGYSHCVHPKVLDHELFATVRRLTAVGYPRGRQLPLAKFVSLRVIDIRGETCTIGSRELHRAAPVGLRAVICSHNRRITRLPRSVQLLVASDCPNLRLPLPAHITSRVMLDPPDGYDGPLVAWGSTEYNPRGWVRDIALEITRALVRSPERILASYRAPQDGLSPGPRFTADGGIDRTHEREWERAFEHAVGAAADARAGWHERRESCYVDGRDMGLWVNHMPPDPVKLAWSHRRAPNLTSNGRHVVRSPTISASEMGALFGTGYNRRKTALGRASQLAHYLEGKVGLGSGFRSTDDMLIGNVYEEWVGYEMTVSLTAQLRSAGMGNLAIRLHTAGTRRHSTHQWFSGSKDGEVVLVDTVVPSVPRSGVFSVVMPCGRVIDGGLIAEFKRHRTIVGATNARVEGGRLDIGAWRDEKERLEHYRNYEQQTGALCVLHDLEQGILVQTGRKSSLPDIDGVLDDTLYRETMVYSQWRPSVARLGERTIRSTLLDVVTSTYFRDLMRMLIDRYIVLNGRPLRSRVDTTDSDDDSESGSEESRGSLL